jgi:hypothetical protein
MLDEKAREEEGAARSCAHTSPPGGEEKRRQRRKTGPRVFRNVEARILASLNVPKERAKLRALDLHQKQAATWDAAHDGL